MKKHLIRAIFIFSFSIIFIVFSSAKSFGQNTVSGIIFDENRRAVSEIEVELLDEFERFVRSAKTKGSGLYMFQGLRAGVYFIRVRTDGTNYQDAKERFQIGQTNRTNRTTGAASGSESLQINLTLQIDSRGGNDPLYNEVVFAQTTPPDAEKLFQEAQKNLDKKRNDDAINNLKKAVEIFPDYFLALDLLGNEYLTQKKFAEAENIFARAAQINAKSFSSHYGLGAARYSLKKFAEAGAALEKAIVINPSSVNSYFLLGKIERETKEFTKAEINLKKADDLADKKLPDIHWELALLYYYDLKQFSKAADELEIYLKVNPKADTKEQVKKLIKTIREKAKEQS